MTENFEDYCKQPKESLSTIGIHNISPGTSAVESISYKALLASSMLGPVAPWPNDSLRGSSLPDQRRSSLAFGEMSFPSRNNSLGLGGDFSFASGNSRRNSLAFGMDFNLGDQQFNPDVAALASQSLGSQSLLNPGLVGANANNAQLQLSALQGGNLYLQQQQQLQLLQQQQQKHHQAMAMAERSSEAKRVQAEAQAAAAALFLGAPIPGHSNDDISSVGTANSNSNSNLGQLGRNDGFSVLSSQHLLGNVGLGGLSVQNAIQASQLLRNNQNTNNANINRDLLSLGLNLGDPSGGLYANASSSDSSNNNNNNNNNSLQSLNSYSLQQQLLQKQQQQLQQLQKQQQQLQVLQTPLPQQLQMQQQQQKQIQQLQLQQELRRQELRRHSLSLSSFPFDSVANQQQNQLQQQPKDVGLNEQLRLHHLQQLDGVAGGGGQAALLAAMDEDKIGHPNKKARRDSKQSASNDQQSHAKGAATSKKDASFPQKLHEILSNPEYQEMIAWMPHGKSWRILKPSAFENVVIPLHFRHSKYASFMRQVNGWGFQRVLHGNDHNSYKHDLFVRDQPDLCKNMKRIGTVKKAKDGIDSEGGGQQKVGGSDLHDESCRPSFTSGSVPTDTSAMITTNSSIIDDSALQNFGGNDVKSISAVRSELSHKFAASIGNFGRIAVTQNQSGVDFGLGQMLQDASSLESIGMGQKNHGQSQNLMKLSPSDILSGKLPQQLQNFPASSASVDGLDFLQQQLAMGSSNGFGDQSISPFSKMGMSGFSGGASLPAVDSQQGDAIPFHSSQFQAALNARSDFASENDNQNVDI